MDYGYGNLLLVIISVVVFLYFVKAAFRPRTKTDWKTYGIFGAFITALFAEMYGFPLTIYLLTSFFGNKFPGLDFSHQSGHILNTILGIKGDPHFSFIHILSNVLIVGGLVLLSSAWNTLYKSSRKGILATAGAYRYIRHPQYLAFILVIIGFLLQWPTLITLIMAPVLVVRYIFLARSEEREMLKKFGPIYENYRSKVSNYFRKKESGSIIMEMKAKFNFLMVLFIAVVLLDTDKKVSKTYGVLTIASSMHRGEFPGHTYIVLGKDGVIRNIFDDPNMRVNNLEIKEALNKIS